MCWCRCHRLLHISNHFGGRLTSTFAISRLPRVHIDTKPNSITRWHSTVHQLHLRRLTLSASSQSTKQDSKADEETEEEKRNRQGRVNPEKMALVSKDFFESLGNRNKESFLMAIDVFTNRDKHGRGHVEFIRSALKSMKTFGLHRDLDAYKKIIDVFPKGKFIATNIWQVEFKHFPKQQDCAIEILEQMETLGVIPDSECEEKLMLIFGDNAFPLRKFRRMMYWMPKFKNLSPWPIPDPMPDLVMEIAKLAIERITSVDLESKVTPFFPLEELDDSIDPTWIVSGQSVTQQRLIEQHPNDRPIYVEGAFRIWLGRVCINYFILRTEPKPVIKPKKDDDDVGVISSIFTEDYVEKEVAHIPSVHEQDDGIILAVCATGTSSLDSVLSWIRFLERTNPRLGKDISVLFTLKSPLGPTDDLTPVTVTEDKVSDDSLLQDGSGTQLRVISNMLEGFPSTEVKHSLTFDRCNPRLDQVGIEDGSDTRFLNWPHHHNGKTRRKDTEQKSSQ